MEKVPQCCFKSRQIANFVFYNRVGSRFEFQVGNSNNKFQFRLKTRFMGFFQGDCRKEPWRDPLCTKTKINQKC